MQTYLTGIPHHILLYAYTGDAAAHACTVKSFKSVRTVLHLLGRGTVGSG